MDTLDLLAKNLTSPMVLAFALGLGVTRVGSTLRLPPGMYTGLSIYLLLAIGLKGGVALRTAGLSAVFWPAMAALCLGLTIPVVVYAVARRAGRLSVDDSAALAAHYGSTSAVTFIAAGSFLTAASVSAESFMPALLAVLEVPAIVLALWLASRHGQGSESSRDAIREVVSGSSVVLLVGGMAMGYATGAHGFAHVEPFFVSPFKGALTLFMLELGVVAGQHLSSLRQHGAFLLGFGVIMPLVHGALGVWLGRLVGLSPGGQTLLGTLAAGASYIAAPAAVRIALPRANPSLYLTGALGITFPFNLALGIPLYFALAQGRPQAVLATLLD